MINLVVCFLSDGFPIFVGELPPVSTKPKLATASAESEHAPPLAKQLEPLPQLLCSLPGNKSPVQLLNELYGTVDFISSDTKDKNNLFHSSIEVEERWFEVCALLYFVSFVLQTTSCKLYQLVIL